MHFMQKRVGDGCRRAQQASQVRPSAVAVVGGGGDTHPCLDDVGGGRANSDNERFKQLEQLVGLRQIRGTRAEEAAKRAEHLLT